MMSHDPTRDSYDLKMYSQRKASVEITQGDPQFVARYVGKTEVYVALGKGCTQAAVQRIWDHCYDEKGMARVSMLINPIGIILGDIEAKSKDRVFNIKDIAYCCAEKGLHDKVFAWICKDSGSSKLECHAVLCSNRERAQLMAMTLHKSFNVAYKDWKHQKDKRARNRARARANTKIEDENHSAGNGLHFRKSSQGSTSQDSESASGESDPGSEGGNPLLETIMAQMNIVEEEEISLTNISINNGIQ